MPTFVVVAGCLGALLAAYGWGRFTLATSRQKDSLPWPLVAAVGLGTVLFAGGCLNAVSLALPPAFPVLLGFGMVMGLWFAYGDRAMITTPEVRPQVAAIVLALLPTAVLAATMVPNGIFDFTDDFEKYLAYPTRMLATGSLAGSTLSSMGLETLGGGAFLQGFVLTLAPLTWIAAADVVFGTLLVLVIVWALAARRGWAVLTLSLPAGSLVLIIAPQMANNSPLFLGVALVAAIILLAAERDGQPSALMMGLLLAGLLSLKTSFLPYVPAAIIALGGASLLRRGVRPALAYTGRLAGWTGLAVAPWLVTHRGNYAVAGNTGKMPEVAMAMDPPSGDIFAMFSFKSLPLGGSYGAYLVTAIGALALSLAILLLTRPKANRPRQDALAVALLAAAVTAILLVLQAYTQTRGTAHYAIRLTIPMVMGTMTAVAVWAVTFPSRAARGCALLAVAVVTALFIAETPARFRHLIEGHSLLAFSWVTEKEEFRAYSQREVSLDRRSRLRAMQDKIPPGQPILVWTTIPFTLDYSRNPIIDADFIGLSTAWARIPDNIRYVFWEYRGFAVRGTDEYWRTGRSPVASLATAGRRALGLARRLQDLAARSAVLHYDENFVVFVAPEPIGPQSNR